MRWQEGAYRQVGKHVKQWELRYLERIDDGNGQSKTIQRAVRLGLVADIGPNKKHAKRLGRPIVDEVNARNGQAKKEITVRWASEQWLKAEVSNHKPSSRASLESNLRKILEHFGDYKCEDVRPRAIQDWANDLPVSPTTVRNYLTTFKMFWKHVRFSEYVKHNPLEGVHPPKQRGKKETPAFTLDQMREILLRATEEPFATMFHILAETGMRGGELCGLFTSDIDLDARIITVSRSAYQGHLQDPKTVNAFRTVHISGRLAERIREYTDSVQVCGRRGPSMDFRRGNTISVPDSSIGEAVVARNSLLFPTETALAWDNSDVVALGLDPILRVMGIKVARMGLHAWRHGNRSLMASLGVNEKYACERAGHATGNALEDNGRAITPMGMNYIHGNEEQHRLIAELLGQALAARKPVSSESVQRMAVGAD